MGAEGRRGGRAKGSPHCLGALPGEVICCVFAVFSFCLLIASVVRTDIHSLACFTRFTHVAKRRSA